VIVKHRRAWLRTSCATLARVNHHSRQSRTHSPTLPSAAAIRRTYIAACMARIAVSPDSYPSACTAPLSPHSNPTRSHRRGAMASRTHAALRRSCPAPAEPVCRDHRAS